MNFLLLQAQLKPNKEAVRDLSTQRSWNYADWERFVAQTAGWLTAQGLRPGDRLACLAKNCAEYIALHFAAARLGLLFVPLNWRLSAAELDSVLEDCQPALVVADVLAEKLSCDSVDISTLSERVVGHASVSDIGLHDAQPTLLLYTSGTTGRPKGILHSEKTLMETTLNMSLLAEVSEQSCYLCEAPMFHVIGLITCIRPVLYHGGKLLISDGFEPPRTLARLQDRTLNISHYFCVPQMANMLRQQPEFNPTGLTHLKAIMTGGAPYPEVQVRAWVKDGIPIVDGYGMSEAGTVFGMPFELAIIDQKAGAVGVHPPRIQARLVDGNEQLVVPGAAGELQLKGDNLFLGIWRQDELYDRCFTADGWFRTGDVAIKDNDGFYRIVDRLKDMFISGGENVYPAEVEAIVLASPLVKECALVGVPDEKWGEVGRLYVVPQDPMVAFDRDALFDDLQRSLARYKLPKQLELLAELPRNAAGKLNKKILKEA